MMQQQIEQMKSSIANIQHHLRKLQCEQTLKINQHQSNILPESILQYEQVYDKPSPTPKITQIAPNITHTDIYAPERHHLDDTEMKKLLRNQTKLASHSKTKNKYHQNRSRSDRKQKSLTIKTKYIYDGARVVYIPPLLQAQSDYGHIVVQQDKKRKVNTNQTERLRNYDAFQQYGSGLTPKAQPKRKTQIQQTKVKKQMKKKSVGNFTKVVALSQPYQQARQPSEVKKIKSIKVQCNLLKQRSVVKKVKIKQPFKIDWNKQTDSQFSELDI